MIKKFLINNARKKGIKLKNWIINNVWVSLNFFKYMWCIWFLSAEKGLWLFINLIMNNLIKSKPGKYINRKIKSAFKIKSEL